MKNSTTEKYQGPPGLQVFNNLNRTSPVTKEVNSNTSVDPRLSPRVMVGVELSILKPQGFTTESDVRGCRQDSLRSRTPTPSVFSSRLSVDSDQQSLAACASEKSIRSVVSDPEKRTTSQKHVSTFSLEFPKFYNFEKYVNAGLIKLLSIGVESVGNSSFPISGYVICYFLKIRVFLLLYLSILYICVLYLYNNITRADHIDDSIIKYYMFIIHIAKTRMDFSSGNTIYGKLGHCLGDVLQKVVQFKAI